MSETTATITMEQARERVTRGAAFLDANRPGWANRIDTGTLALHDPCGCIVGQLCGGNFYRGVRELSGLYTYSDMEAFAIERGFELHNEEYGLAEQFGSFDDPERVRAFTPLQNAWIEAIADRVVDSAASEHQAVQVQEAGSPVPAR